MIKTYIIKEFKEGNFIYHDNEGLALTKEIARWIFRYCGWEEKGSVFPFLSFKIIIEVLDADAFLLESRDTIWVLNMPLLLN